MTSETAKRTVVIGGETDIVAVRQAAREAAIAAGFSLVQQTKLVTAASELARNALIHGGGGQAEIVVEDTAAGRTVRLVFADSGPGIPDVDLAMSDGYSTGSGLGLGLGGARRLADTFTVESAPGKGTRIELTITGRKNP